MAYEKLLKANRFYCLDNFLNTSNGSKILDYTTKDISDTNSNYSPCDDCFSILSAHSINVNVNCSSSPEAANIVDICSDNTYTNNIINVIVADNKSDTRNIVKSNSIQSEITITNKNKCNTLGLVKKGLRIVNLNIRHILPKLDELKLIIKDERSVYIFGIPYVKHFSQIAYQMNNYILMGLIWQDVIGKMIWGEAL